MDEPRVDSLRMHIEAAPGFEDDDVLQKLASVERAGEHPFFGLLLSPVVASAAMALWSISVIVDALRLRGVQVD